ncbi:MAG: DUF1848 domain-containing protein [Candidatus Coatesbacteria bacterium]|nr:DUF1848 domain-containing protein [Candidatus Coatesbacteria bacterium]
MYPLIVSASRSTDIPAFYGEDLIRSLFNKDKAKRYMKWYNPFNRKPLLVSFLKTRLIVFWSKNPEPFFKHLEMLDNEGMNYYFQLTLNDYDNENYEKNLPLLKDRIEIFRELSDRIGKGKVLWRFDPVILSDTISKEKIQERIFEIGEKLYGFTERLTISFIEKEKYKRVKSNLLKNKVNIRDITTEDKKMICSSIADFNRKWKLELFTCAEKEDLIGFNHGKCIDDDLIKRLFHEDEILMDFVCNHSLEINGEKVVLKSIKDKGQRDLCNCIISKDIGRYNTCRHNCIYCYANNSK